MRDSDPIIPEGGMVDGRYRISELLGAGGVGQVYAAEDLRLGRQVALKIVRHSGGDDDAGERLFLEAKAAARADHPAVIIAFGYGTDSELACDYFVMERLYGQTVTQRIAAAGPLPLALVQHIALETADALIAVHEADVVHRDLKPSNLFLAKRGRRDDVVVLLDFGVAKHLHLQSMTATGQIWGTLQYMAPEQLTDSKRVDARSDIYAFGAVLYECLTGKPVFQSQCAVALGHDVVNRPAPDARALRSDTPDALAMIVARCLSKAPGDRFQNAASLYGALSALPSRG